MSDNWSYLQSSTPDRCGMHWDGKECGKPGTLVRGYVLCPTCSERMDEPSEDYLTAMVDGYIKAALRTTYTGGGGPDGDAGEPLSAWSDASDLSPTARDSIESDCEAFATDNWADLKDMDPAQAGHGVGFWDRGLGDRGDRLTAAAHVWGESGLYIGDSGDIHTTNESTRCTDCGCDQTEPTCDYPNCHGAGRATVSDQKLCTEHATDYRAFSKEALA